MNQQHTPHNPELPPVAMPASQPIFIKLVWLSLIITAALVIVGGAIGFFVASTPGLWGAVVGAVIGGLFMGISAASIALANRAIASPMYVPIFFGTILGTMLLKFVLFLVVAFTLAKSELFDSKSLFITVIVGIVASLAVDLIVILRSRIPAVSDARLEE